MVNPFDFLMDKNAVSVDVVRNAIDSSTPLTIIDVRTKEEYDTGHIQGSILIPLTDLLENLSKIPDTPTTLYVYCRSGSRSRRAVDSLKALGYTNVHNISGGIIAWLGRNYPLVT